VGKRLARIVADRIVERWGAANLRRFYDYRGVLISPPLIFAFSYYRAETEREFIVWPLGFSLFLVGVLLRIWAQQHLHYRIKAHKALTTTGPYSFVRNPIYIGNTLICVGTVIVSELLWLAPIALLWCAAVYSLVVRYEERHLLERYGLPYRQYVSRVPRWFPYPRREHFDLINENFKASFLAEAHCFLILIPPLFKEVVSNGFHI